MQFLRVFLAKNAPEGAFALCGAEYQSDAFAFIETLVVAFS